MSTSGQLPLAGMEPPVVAAPDRVGPAQADDISTAVDTSIERTGQADVAYVIHRPAADQDHRLHWLPTTSR